MAGRLAQAFGEPFDAALPSETSGPKLTFPSPQRLVDAQLEDIGVISSRAVAIRSLAHAVIQGSISFDPTQDPDSFTTTLTAIKGIGDWTAQYLSMRLLRNPDAFPASDLGLRKGVDPKQLLTPSELKIRAEDWRPWRAYAAMLLWQGPNSSGE